MYSIVLSSPGAVFLQLGPITIRWYGVLIAVGFLIACHFASLLAKKRCIDSERLVNLALVSFIAGIIGARLYFVLLNWTEYVNCPQNIFATWLGGLSIHGGLIGGVIGGVIYALIYKCPKRQFADIIACCLPLAQAIGRWGNFYNSEAFGCPVPVNFPISVLIPKSNRPYEYQNYELFHATFLYESIYNFIVFLILYNFLFYKFKNYPGFCFLSYLILYSFGRLLIEPLRTDSIRAGTIPVPIIASAITIVVAISLIPRFYYLAKKDLLNFDTKVSENLTK